MFVIYVIYISDP